MYVNRNSKLPCGVFINDVQLASKFSPLQSFHILQTCSDLGLYSDFIHLPTQIISKTQIVCEDVCIATQRKKEFLTSYDTKVESKPFLQSVQSGPELQYLEEGKKHHGMTIIKKYPLSKESLSVFVDIVHLKKKSWQIYFMFISSAP